MLPVSTSAYAVIEKNGNMAIYLGWKKSPLSVMFWDLCLSLFFSVILLSLIMGLYSEFI